MQPVLLQGKVVRGFGRGRQLGIPTANIDRDSVTEQLPTDFTLGIYYGWARLEKVDNDGKPYSPMPMVASVGLNPFYKNTNLTVEVHILRTSGFNLPRSFYGSTLRVVFSGYVRGERDFSSTVGLLDAIKEDILVATENLSKTPQIHIRETFFGNSIQQYYENGIFAPSSLSTV